MKNTILLFIFFYLILGLTNLQAQDPSFSQWENIPIYFNPALTGDFDGLIRLRVKYRDQWRSFLEEDAYMTGVGSAEYKFTGGENRKISIGFFGLHDQAGERLFTINSYHLSSSIVQNLGNLESNHHSISLGVSVGAASKKINLDDFRFPSDNPFMPGPGQEPEENLNEKINYFDLSAGLNWTYHTTTHFSAQLGAAISHLNKPNESFGNTDNQSLPMRFNVHGNIELPLAKILSIEPSFLYFNQQATEDLLFGLSGKWYLKESTNNFLKLGFFAKSVRNFNGTNIGVYVGSVAVEINSILMGFTYDHFRNLPLDAKAYEFSVGYTIGGKPATN